MDRLGSTGVRPVALAALLLSPAMAAPATQVRTDAVVEGKLEADGKARTFLGIPFAAPPVGQLRWQSPRPVAAWTGVRKSVEFGRVACRPGSATT